MLMAKPTIHFRYFMESRWQKPDGEWGYWHLGEHGRAMVKRYREEARRKFGEDFFSADNKFGCPMDKGRWDNGTGWVRVNGMPIFWEFVKYIINEPMSKIPFEWRPIYYHAGPCDIKYEITGKSYSMSHGYLLRYSVHDCPAQDGSSLLRPGMV